MSSILLAAMPFTGHVAPITALATALVDRGHDVRVYTGRAFAAQVTAAGARHVAWNAASDFDEHDLAATFPRLRSRRGLRQVLVNIADLFIATAPGQVHDLAAEFEREPWDLLVGEESSVGPALAAEQLGTPWATAAILPLSLPSRSGPPSGLGLAPGRTPLGRGRDALLRRLVPMLMRPLDAPLAAARRDIGLPESAASFDTATFSPFLVVASGVVALDHDRADRPAHLHWIGRFDRPAASPAALPGWWPDLEGRRVVLVTQGTQNIDTDDLIRPALDALAGEDVIVVATTGIAGRDHLPFAVPANARVAGIVPLDRLLPLADLVITNGGWGGVLAALAHGTPLVVAGADLDKPEVAARVAASGAGIDLRTGSPRPAAILRAFREITTDTRYADAARALASQMGAAGGSRSAADALTAFAGARSGGR